jgi:hypothetical protein
MKSLLIFLTVFFCQMIFVQPSFAGGDGVFPFDLETGHWETYSGKYTVRFEEIEDDHRHLNIFIFGWDKQHALAWGKVSQKASNSRESILLIKLTDNQGAYWSGILYRGGLGLNLYMSDGCQEVTLELIDRNIPPHY